jgi:hypothetical protein
MGAFLVVTIFDHPHVDDPVDSKMMSEAGATIDA